MANIITPIKSDSSLSQANGISIARLLQLCSASLPVGGFSFSQGLEYAVEADWVNDPKSCHEWVTSLLETSIVTTDLAVLYRMSMFWSDYPLTEPLTEALNDNIMDKKPAIEIQTWNQFLIASRESYELQQADIAMGLALLRLIEKMPEPEPYWLKQFRKMDKLSFVTLFGYVAHKWKISIEQALEGYCWTVIDNQVAAATKLIPLGQTQAQNLLFSLSEAIPNWVKQATQLKDDELGYGLPRLAMASAWHETQYTRLFRS